MFYKNTTKPEVNVCSKFENATTTMVRWFPLTYFISFASWIVNSIVSKLNKVNNSLESVAE